MGDRLQIDPAYRQCLSQLGLDSVAKVLALNGDGAAGAGPRVFQFDVPGRSDQPAMHIKRFDYPTWRTRIMFLGRCLFGRSRARREFRCLRLMHRLGIQSSRPLSWGERRVLGVLCKSYLILEGVPASDSLGDFAVRYFHKAASPRGQKLKRAMMDQLADQVCQMHGKHFYHGDLAWNNILVRPTPRGDFEFYFINALRGRRVWLPWKHRRMRARDLAGIEAIGSEFLTRADKIRFMKRYLQRDELTDADRQWMKRIQRISRQLYGQAAPVGSACPGAGAPRNQVEPSVRA